MAEICPACQTPYKSEKSQFCSHCGMARHQDVTCEKCGAILEPDDCYCDICGAQTVFGQKLDEALGK